MQVLNYERDDVCLKAAAWWVVHAHVDAAGSELFEHLVEAFQLGFGSFGACYPTDVVVLLVGWSGVEVVDEAVVGQSVFDELRHGVNRPG